MPRMKILSTVEQEAFDLRPEFAGVFFSAARKIEQSFAPKRLLESILADQRVICRRTLDPGAIKAKDPPLA